MWGDLSGRLVFGTEQVQQQDSKPTHIWNDPTLFSHKMFPREVCRPKAVYHRVGVSGRTA